MDFLVIALLLDQMPLWAQWTLALLATGLTIGFWMWILSGKQESWVARYCVHASYEIPLGDQLLAQAISLRLDEEHIIGKANKTALAA